MVQMTSYFLGHNIQLVLTTGLLEDPFKTFQANFDRENLIALGIYPGLASTISCTYTPFSY